MLASPLNADDAVVQNDPPHSSQLLTGRLEWLVSSPTSESCHEYA